MKPMTSAEVAAAQKQGGGPNAPASNGTDVTPSANLKAFDHNEYQISYPENWKVFGRSELECDDMPCLGAEQMYQASRSLNVPTQLDLPGREPHADGAELPGDRLTRYVDWYDRYLGLAAQGGR